MVRIACPSSDWHQDFLRMLPIIVRHAKFSFRRLRPEARSEAVQEVVANCCRAYLRLVELGKTSLAYPNVLARYGVKQVRDHRKVGGKLNVHDVLGKYCQSRKHVVVERLDRRDKEENGWYQILVEDKSAGPADTACSRIDFGDWLGQLPRRNRRIAEFLSLGHRTDDTARKFKVSSGRISQLRKELAESWKKFVGDDEPGAAALAA
ncbi:MAG: hypothetical protein WCJ35_10670 [Planctomycetota bacterium]